MIRKLNLALSVFALLAIAGCKKESPGIGADPIVAKTAKKHNPYSVANMRQAIATLLVGDVQLSKAGKTGFVKGKMLMSTTGAPRQMSMDRGLAIAVQTISASHYYIKFMPRDQADYDKLKADSNLTIYPFPLDNPKQPYSGSYRDPGLPLGVPTYQYAAVRVSQQLPNVPYEKLEELFLPVEQASGGLITLSENNQSIYAVSARMLASESECSEGETGGGDNGGGQHEEQMPTDDDWYCGPGGPGTGDPYDDGYNFRAHGRITAVDNTLGTVGLEGLRVRAYRWFTTYNGFTDANGYYAVDGTFTNPPNYWMDFERYEFSVNDGSGGPREIGGPQIRAAWDLHFTDGQDKFCSEIFRAAYHYYYKDIQGLNRPPENGFWNTQMKLGAFYQSGTSNTLPIRHTFGLGEMIKIYNPQVGSRQVYATTIHELGHTVHLQLTGGIWADNDVCESWARGVEFVLTRMQYPDYLGGSNNIPEGYTNVVVDMPYFRGTESV